MQDLQQAIVPKARTSRNEKDFDNLCDTESPCAPDCPYLTESKHIPHAQLELSRLILQKLRLNNIIILYVSRPKYGMLLFEEELDANTSLILNQTECVRCDEEFSDD